MAGRYDDEPGHRRNRWRETAAALEAALDDEQGVVPPAEAVGLAEQPAGGKMCGRGEPAQRPGTTLPSRRRAFG